MGGGSKFAYPKWVWSYTGGWWANPQHWKRNTLVTAAGMTIIAGVAWNFSSKVEVRTRYPDMWIPSMLWSKEFHDPQHIKLWKSQLEKEGRKWIDPIPDWMPKWWPYKNPKFE